MSFQETLNGLKKKTVIGATVLAAVAAPMLKGEEKQTDAIATVNMQETMKSENTPQQKITEIRQKLAYLDEYMANIEAGKSKEDALKILEMKLANGNEKDAELLDKQIKSEEKKGGSNLNDWLLIGVVSLNLGLVIGRELEKSKIERKRKEELKNKMHERVHSQGW